MLYKQVIIIIIIHKTITENVGVGSSLRWQPAGLTFSNSLEKQGHSESILSQAKRETLQEVRGALKWYLSLV